MVKNYTSKKSKKEIDDIILNIKKNRNKLLKLKNKIKNHKIVIIIDIINTYIWLRTERLEVWRKSMIFTRNFYLYILKKM